MDIFARKASLPAAGAVATPPRVENFGGVGVILDAIDTQLIISAIRAIEAHTQHGTVKAHRLVACTPCVLLRTTDVQQASGLADELRKLGGVLRVVPDLELEAALLESPFADDEPPESWSEKSSVSVRLEVGTEGAFEVVLDGISGERVKLLKELRSLTGMDVAGARQMLDSLPAVVGRARGPAKARRAVEVLQSAGGLASFRRSAGDGKSSLHRITLEDLGHDRLDVLWEVRRELGISVRAAAELLDGAPNLVLGAWPTDEGWDFHRRLTEAGATVRFDDEEDWVDVPSDPGSRDASASSPGPSTTAYRFCGNCGTPRTASYGFCGNCGDRFPDAT